MKSFFIVIFSILCISLQAQNVEDLNYYADIVANAHAPAHRARANADFVKAFDQWIASPNFKKEDLTEIKYIMVKEPEDKSFSLVTWQLLSDKSQYFGYIFKDGKATKLIQNTNILADNKYTELSAKEWYGAMYYNILETSANGQKYYTIFGYNAFKDGMHVKMVDVLTFDGSQPLFGAEIFNKKVEGARDDVSMRLILPYSENATVKLNYDRSLGMIIHDHIIKKQSSQGELFIPDGSYIGYKWNEKTGQFDYVDKVFNQVSSTPPTASKKQRTKAKKLYRAR